MARQAPTNLGPDTILIWFIALQVFIQDTGSSSGTFLNNQRLVERVSTVSPPFEVKDSDIIQIGRDYELGVSTTKLLCNLSHAA
jgi:pSer/pThr/pTyr-binding forkhead associated (FHA) protein